MLCGSWCCWSVWCLLLFFLCPFSPVDGPAKSRELWQVVHARASENDAYRQFGHHEHRRWCIQRLFLRQSLFCCYWQILSCVACMYWVWFEFCLLSLFGSVLLVLTVSLFTHWHSKAQLWLTLSLWITNWLSENRFFTLNFAEMLSLFCSENSGGLKNIKQLKFVHLFYC